MILLSWQYCATRQILQEALKEMTVQKKQKKYSALFDDVKLPAKAIN